jgi:glutamate formiminotransferase
MPLIECIPNISEGRDQAVIDTITATVRAVCGVHLLDVSADADHNRTVVTFCGEPEPVAVAAFRLAEQAARLIDLRDHAGVHPRMGALDVLPFVPLRACSMAQAVDVARRVGKRIGKTLELPVYLYEEAATRPERVNLADVRRPRYEGLKSLISQDPAWVPDYGPAQIGSAGAVAVGARAPLIAFNAFLDTDDPQVAQAIAQTVRASGGGLPYLKALGLLVDGRAQVSMNVTDFRQTGLWAIYQAVAQAAATHGVQIIETELVGLMPRAALIDAALDALKLPAGSRGLILDDHIGTMTGNFETIRFE